MPRSFAVLLAVCLLGCGGGSKPPSTLVPVSGKILMNGKPLTSAAVTYVADGPKGGVGAVGFTDDQGKYELKWRGQATGVQPGKYKVILSRMVMKDGSPLPPDKSAAYVGAIETMSRRYTDFDVSELYVDVPAGGTTKDFELKSK
ncbi:MAG TPA: carboxypeptidase regulatory-like domain-containing protein [Caulifigura sp.]|jgi:hypothetical protein|nr:carboxypeptidase regulatory-like domain-containing protein [Caulifigura sp.]